MQIIAIASGESGVGNSMLSSNLAIALGQNGKRVVVVDLNLGNSSLHLTLGISGSIRGMGAYFDNTATRLEEIIYQTEYENLSMIPAEPGLPGIASMASGFKRSLLHGLRRLDWDYMFLDLGAGLDYNIMDFFLLSGNSIIVIDPTLKATLNAYLLLKNSIFRIMGSKFGKKSTAYSYLKQLRKDGISLQKIYLTKILEQIREIDPQSYEKMAQGMSLLSPKMVLNMVRDPKDMQRTNKLRSSCRQYLSVDLGYLGVIYYDEAQADALKGGLPVVAYKPQAIISQAIYRIADNILEMGPCKLSPLGDDRETMYEFYDDSYGIARKEEAGSDYRMRYGPLQESLYSGLLVENDMIETIKSQHFDIKQLKLENQYLKKRLLDAAKKGEIWSKNG